MIEELSSGRWGSSDELLWTRKTKWPAGDLKYPMEKDSDSRDTHLEELRDSPPSAKLVFKILEYEGHLTQKEIANETLLSPRTARYALTKLEEDGIVTSKISFSDARQNVYSLGPEFIED